MNQWNVQWWPRSIVMIAVAGVTGCTTYLDAKLVSSMEGTPPAGAPYHLTFTQYTVTVTRRLVCEPSMGVVVSPALTREEVRDPKRTYVIDLEALQSGLKSTDLSVTYYESGALKAVNAAAEDRTGEVIVSAVGTLGKVVLAAAGGMGTTAVGEEPPAPACHPTAKGTLATIKKLEDDIKSQTRRVKELEAELTILTAAGQTLGDAWDTDARRKHTETTKALFEESTALETKKRDLAEHLKTVSVVSKAVGWPLHGDQFVSVDDREKQKPLVPDLDKTTVQGWLLMKDATAEQSVIDGSRVFARLCSVSPIGRPVRCDGAPEDEKAKDEWTKREQGLRGLKYRVPVQGRLQICNTTSCNDSVFADEESLFSQLGPIFTLPLKSAVFTHKTVVAEFDQQGRPAKLGVASKAAAEKAASTADAVVDKALVVRDGLVSTKLERIKEETALLTAQKELEAARAALAPPPATSEQVQAREAFAADTALLEAELANVEARIALEAAKRLAAQP